MKTPKFHRAINKITIHSLTCLADYNPPPSFDSVPIKSIGLSKKVANRLCRAGLTTVGHVRHKSLADMMGLDSLGIVTIWELYRKLRELGIPIIWTFRGLYRLPSPRKRKKK